MRFAQAARLAFGEDLEPVYHLEKADVIVSLEADFLAWGPARLKDARAFAARRDPGEGGAAASMNRLYVVECTPSLTGAAADHRLAIPARDVAPLAASARRRNQDRRSVRAGGSGGAGATLRSMPAWIKALVRDLTSNRGKSLVIAGETQPPAVHALAHFMNDSLGNIGKTVEFFPRADAGPATSIGSLSELAARYRGGQGRDTDHPGRQPCLRRAGRPRLCPGPALGEDQAAHSSGSLRR